MQFLRQKQTQNPLMLKSDIFFVIPFNLIQIPRPTDKEKRLLQVTHFLGFTILSPCLTSGCCIILVPSCASNSFFFFSASAFVLNSATKRPNLRKKGVCLKKKTIIRGGTID